MRHVIRDLKNNMQKIKTMAVSLELKPQALLIANGYFTISCKPKMPRFE
jgi:hypothetical protein